jgi:cytoskeletal protein RodZ
MIKLMIGALLITTTTLAQTAPQTVKSSSTKSVSASTVTRPSKQPATSAKSTTKSNSTSTAADASRRSSKPIPKPSLSDNLESKDNAIPSYKKAKQAGEHKVKPKFSPRRTASGARPDTMDRRKQ